VTKLWVKFILFEDLSNGLNLIYFTNIYSWCHCKHSCCLHISLLK